MGLLFYTKIEIWAAFFYRLAKENSMQGFWEAVLEAINKGREQRTCSLCHVLFLGVLASAASKNQPGIKLR